MDLNYSPDELAFRDEVRGWLRTNLPADLRQKMESYQDLTKDELLRWHKILAKKGWVAPDWPPEWGGTDAGQLKLALLYGVDDVPVEPDPLDLQVERVAVGQVLGAVVPVD